MALKESIVSITRSSFFKFVYSIGQGNFTFVRKRSGKSQGVSETSGCGNQMHVNIAHKRDIVVVSHVEFC